MKLSNRILEKIDATHFVPFPLLKSGMSQTISAFLLPAHRNNASYSLHYVSLADGDHISLHIDKQNSLKSHIVLLIHGLGGSHQSRYIQRLAPKLAQAGYKVILLNLRGCGSGIGYAKSIYHSGRSDDVHTVLCWIAEKFPNYTVTVLGFSLGGNIALKLAGEIKQSNLHSILAVSPPLCLYSSVLRLNQKSNRLLSQYYLNQLTKHVQKLHSIYPDLPQPKLQRVRTLLEFDEQYTAQRSGFKNALDYYQTASCFQYIPQITIPTLILYAKDDPIIDPTLFYKLPHNLDLIMTDAGGHVGWIGNNRPQLRWMDHIILKWLNWLLTGNSH